MIYQSGSAFPDKVDPLIFFQDIDISQVTALKEYQRFIRIGKYDEANEYMKHHNLHGYCAGLFNLIENRIYTLQKYLLTKEKVNPIVCQAEEPTNAVKNYTIWESRDEKNESTEEVIE